MLLPFLTKYLHFTMCFIKWIIGAICCFKVLRTYSLFVLHLFSSYCFYIIIYQNNQYFILILLLLHYNLPEQSNCFRSPIRCVFFTKNRKAKKQICLLHFYLNQLTSLVAVSSFPFLNFARC